MWALWKIAIHRKDSIWTGPWRLPVSFEISIFVSNLYKVLWISRIWKISSSVDCDLWYDYGKCVLGVGWNRLCTSCFTMWTELDLTTKGNVGFCGIHGTHAELSFVWIPCGYNGQKESHHWWAFVWICLYCYFKLC